MLDYIIGFYLFILSDLKMYTYLPWPESMEHTSTEINI